jgi:AraC-like DNA-binding protein
MARSFHESNTEGQLVCRNDAALHSACLKSPEKLAISGRGLFFMFLTGGGGEWWDGMRGQALAAGDVFLVNAATGGSLRVANGSSMPFFCFSLGLDHLWALCATHELCLLESVMDRLKAAKLHVAAAPIAQRCFDLLRQVPREQNLEHRTQLLRVAAALLCDEFEKALPPRSGYVRNEQHLLQVLEKLPASDIVELPIDELASRFSCSRRQLNRLFQRYFGRSAGALRMEMRLLRAASLLRDYDAKIINVAQQCGFNHLGLFNTCFKRRFEVCPSEWRGKIPESEHQFVKLVGGHPECELRAQGLCAWVGEKKPGGVNPGRGRQTSLRSSAGRPLTKGHLSLSLSDSFKKNSKGEKTAAKTSGASVTPSRITFRVRGE